MASVVDATLDSAPLSVQANRRPVVLLALALFVLYLATASYSNPYGTDAFTNAAQARAFAEDQDPILEELDGLADPQFRGSVAWFTVAPGGTTSQYPPGAAMWTAPFYLLDTSFETITLYDDASSPGERVPIEVAVPSTHIPAAVAAGLSVAIAIGLFGLTLSASLSDRATLTSMAIGGLGTGAWSVAADEIWQHGPAMMCLSAGNYFASRDRFGVSGLAFAAGILVRPHTAVIAACVGLAVAVSRRSLREVAQMGGVTALGLGALLAYNNAVFGSYSISGGYGEVFADRFVNDPPCIVLTRLGESLIHIRVGMLWTSPFLGVAFFALWKHRRAAPDWSIGAALGAFVYLAIQFRANRVTGGAGFFGYRYPLEALMAAGPMLAITTWQLLRGNERVRRLFNVLAALSILAHGTGAVFF